MKQKIITVLSELSASQHGLFTTAQAAKSGVSRNAIAYLAQSGRIERLTQGVYVFGGTPRDGFEQLRAIWMATQPESMTYDRMVKWDGITVGGRTAAAVHGIGDFYLSPFEFFASKRINTRRKDIKIVVRPISQDDVDFTRGFPVTSMTRTLFDLRKNSEDTDLLNKTLIDALYSRSVVDYQRLKELFSQDVGVRGGLPQNTFSKLFSNAGLEVLEYQEELTALGGNHMDKRQIILYGKNGELIPLKKLHSNPEN